MQHYKLLLIALVSIFLIGLISADALPTLKNAKLNQEYLITQACFDATYINFTLTNLDGIVISNAPMTLNGSGTWTYNFTPTTLGRYDFTGVSDGCTFTFATSFEVTPNGEEVTVGKTLFYLGLLLILIMFFIFAVFNIWKTTSYGWTMGLLCISYILLIGVLLVGWQIAENFLTAIPFISTILYVLWILSIICFFPFIIILFILMFEQMINEKNISKLESRGFSTTDAMKRNRNAR